MCMRCVCYKISYSCIRVCECIICIWSFFFSISFILFTVELALWLYVFLQLHCILYPTISMSMTALTSRHCRTAIFSVKTAQCIINTFSMYSLAKVVVGALCISNFYLSSLQRKPNTNLNGSCDLSLLMFPFRYINPQVFKYFLLYRRKISMSAMIYVTPRFFIYRAFLIIFFIFFLRCQIKCGNITYF